LIVKALQSPDDPRTLASWARTAGISVGALRAWCRAAGIAPRQSRDFARVLRALVIATEEGWRVEEALDVIDPRTLGSLLTRAGLPASSSPNISAYLQNQHFVRSPQLLKLVAEHIEREISFPAA
jgi:hypothetical protein